MRHQLTREEKIRGLRAAIASRKTPRRLKAGLRKHLAQLEGTDVQDKRSRSLPRRERPAGFLGWLKL